MVALLNYWLGRSSLSHPQMAAIAAWGLGEDGFIENTTLSRAKNGKLPMGCSLRALLAFGAANHVIWLWQTSGPEACIRDYGPFQAWGVREASLVAAQWLPHPDHPDEPLEFADLCEVQAGLMVIPYLPENVLSPSRAIEASDRLSDLLNRVIGDAGLSARDGLVALLAAYPVEQARRQSRLRALVIGTARLSAGELQTELLAVAEAIRVLRKLPVGSYGPSELLTELGS